MSEQKKINIDMNLFNFSNNKTRKKKSSENNEGIKIKQPSQKKKKDINIKNDTTTSGRSIQ
jgi:hypothetical protein